MPNEWGDWKHVTKIDPDKSLLNGDSYTDIAATGTDAIIVGGTTNVTETAVHSILDPLTASDIPVYIELTYQPTTLDHNAVTGYFIPVVLNAGDTTWIVGAHKEWVCSMKDIDWKHIHPEAYLVLNPAADVARYTQATCDLTPQDVAAYAEVAERLLGQDIVYLESSGTLIDPDLVVAAQEGLSSASLFYGGGIHDYESAAEMATIADTIIVGDLLHESGIQAIEETVRGATDSQ